MAKSITLRKNWYQIQLIHHHQKQLKREVTTRKGFNDSIRVFLKRRLQAKFASWVWGDRRLDFSWRSFRMKRETNDSEVNHLLSFDNELKRSEWNYSWLPQVLVAQWEVNLSKKILLLALVYRLPLRCNHAGSPPFYTSIYTSIPAFIPAYQHLYQHTSIYTSIYTFYTSMHFS